MSVHNIFIKLWNYFFIAYIAIILLLWLLVTFPIFLVIFPFTMRRGRKIWRIWMTLLWRYVFFLSSPWVKIKIKGKEFVDRKQTYIIVVNHVSFLDGLLTSQIPLIDQLHFTKNSIFKSFGGFWGFFMKVAGYLNINQNSFEELTEKVKKINGDGASIVIFSEGKRIKTGKLARFRNGAFMLSKELGLPILPVALKGTGSVSTWNFKDYESLSFKPSSIEIEICPSVNPEDYESHRELRNEVKSIISEKIYG